MKKGIKELTEGMQRLCAVANRIVSGSEKPSRIEVDLLLDDLRRLYDVALMLREEPASAQATMDEEALLSSTMMATRAAMVGDGSDVESHEEPETKETPENTEASMEVETPREPEHIMAEVEIENGLMFDEVVIEKEPKPQPEPEKQPKASSKRKQKPLPEPAPVPKAEPQPELEPEPQPEPEPEPTPEPKPEPEPQHAPEPKPEPEPEPEPVREQISLLFAEEQPAAKEEKPVEEVKPVEEEKPAEEEKRQPSLLDYLRHPTEEEPTVRTLGDTLRGSIPSPGASLERKVSDLRTVININDKFSFMTELFRGNMKAYNDFIMQLNDIADRDEAESLVKATAEQYHWDEGSLAVSNFHKVFDKKF